MSSEARSSGPPMALIVLAMLALLVGGFGLVRFFVLILTSLGLLLAAPATGSATAESGVILFVRALLVGIGAGLACAFGAGALQLKSWAWWCGVAGAALGIVGAILELLAPDGGFIHWVLLIAYTAILVYLWRPAVRHLFEDPTGSVPA